ncbi:hypothetical protein Tco_0319566 [Tanacetum coccineum]
MDDAPTTLRGKNNIRLERKKRLENMGKCLTGKLLAIVFNDNLTSNETLSCEHTVSSLNDDEIDFRISCDESDDEDYTISQLNPLYALNISMNLILKMKHRCTKYGEEHEADDMGFDPSDIAFTEWLRSKFFNYKTMDHYTMKALWIYWIRGDDEVELTDEEFF